MLNYSNTWIVFNLWVCLAFLVLEESHMVLISSLDPIRRAFPMAIQFWYESIELCWCTSCFLIDILPLPCIRLQCSQSLVSCFFKSEIYLVFLRTFVLFVLEESENSACLHFLIWEAWKDEFLTLESRWSPITLLVRVLV